MSAPPMAGQGYGQVYPPYMNYNMPPSRVPPVKAPRPLARNSHNLNVSMACTERAPVYVFTSDLAIEAEKAVKRGEYSSIIEFHQNRCPRPIKRETTMNNNAQCNAAGRVPPVHLMDKIKPAQSNAETIKAEPKSPAISQAQNRCSSVGPLTASSPRPKPQSPRGRKRGALSPASVPPHLGNPSTPKTPAQYTNPASVGPIPSDFTGDYANGSKGSGIGSVPSDYNYACTPMTSSAGDMCNQPIREMPDPASDDPIKKMERMTDLALPFEPPMKAARLDTSGGATLGPLAAVKDSIMSPSMARSMEQHYQQAMVCDPADTGMSKLTPEQLQHREQQLQKIDALRNQFHLNDGGMGNGDRGAMMQPQMMPPPGYRHPGPHPMPMYQQQMHMPHHMFNPENRIIDEFSSDKARIEWQQMLQKHEQEKFFEKTQNNGGPRMGMMGYPGPGGMGIRHPQGMLVPPSGPALRGIGPVSQPRPGMRGPSPRHINSQHMMPGPPGHMGMMYPNGGARPPMQPGPGPQMMYSQGAMMPMDVNDPEHNPPYYMGPQHEMINPYPHEMYPGVPQQCMSDFNAGANGEPSVMMVPPGPNEFGGQNRNGKMGVPGPPYDMDYAAIRGPVPSTSMRVHPPTVNNTYVNATMSIQQMTIQNMGPPIHHPGGHTTMQLQGPPHGGNPPMMANRPHEGDVFPVEPLTNLDAKVPSQKLSYFPNGGGKGDAPFQGANPPFPNGGGKGDGPFQGGNPPFPNGGRQGDGPFQGGNPPLPHVSSAQFFDNFPQQLWATSIPGERRGPPTQPPSSG